jgi:hypothetical protein
LEYVTGTTGHRYTAPVRYFPWDGNDVPAFGGGTSPQHVRHARNVRLRIGGRRYPAKPEVIATAALLAELAQRNGPRTAQRLVLGLPGDRPETRPELLAAAGTSTITRFSRMGPPG